MPIFADGRWWGVLGFGETRYARQWAGPEVECLEAAAAVLGSAIERERSEEDRERRDRILEAVAFSAAQLLEAGTWQARADEVLERLGRSADAARILLMDVRAEADGSSFARLRHSWQAPGVESPFTNSLVKEGVRVQALGLERLEAELRASRPVVSLVPGTLRSERSFPVRMGSKSLAAVPVFADGESWGFLGFGETRFERGMVGPRGRGPEGPRPRCSARPSSASTRTTRSGKAKSGSHAWPRRLSRDRGHRGGRLRRQQRATRPDVRGRGETDLVGRQVETLWRTRIGRRCVKERVTTRSEEPYRAPGSAAGRLMFPCPWKCAFVRLTAVAPCGSTAIRDVSERVQAEVRQRRREAELRQSADQWRQTFDALDLGGVLADADGRIVRSDTAARSMSQEVRPSPMPWEVGSTSWRAGALAARSSTCTARSGKAASVVRRSPGSREAALLRTLLGVRGPGPKERPPGGS